MSPWPLLEAPTVSIAGMSFWTSPSSAEVAVTGAKEGQCFPAPSPFSAVSPVYVRSNLYLPFYLCREVLTVPEGLETRQRQAGLAVGGVSALSLSEQPAR